MSKRRASILRLGILFALVATQGEEARAQADSASFETNREVMRAFANFHIDQRQFKKAQTRIHEFLEQYPTEASAWNLLGLTYLRSKDEEEAKKAFFRAAKFSRSTDRKGVYLYNYADALVRGRKIELAERVLVKAEKYDEVGASASDALNRLRPGQPLPPVRIPEKSNWALLGSFSSGYDNNVLLISDASLATTERSGTASFFGNPLLMSRYVEGTRNGRWEASMVGSYVHYTNSSATTFNALYGSADVQWVKRLLNSQGFFWGLGNKAEVTFLNENNEIGYFSFSQKLYGRLMWQQSLKSRTEFLLPVRYQNYQVDESDDPDDDRTGWGAVPTLMHQYTFRDVNRFRFGLEFEGHQASGKNFRARSFSFPLSWARPIYGGVDGVLGLTYSILDYYESTTGRRDRVFRGTFVLSKNLFPRAVGSIDYRFRRNASNVTSADYNKHTIRVTFSYVLL